MQKNLFSSFLEQLTDDFTPVVAPRIFQESYIPLDLSSENNTLKDVDISSSKAMEQYINELLDESKAQVAYGGYLEKRAIYERSLHFNRQDPNTARNIHLGVDLWIGSGTDVLAVLDGTIHSFQDNTNFGDYGPTIILKHLLENHTFYTLYGHLSRESLASLKVGESVKKGQAIARLGSALLNGDYAPHLHFQIIKDLQGKKGDYPGVCSKTDLQYFSENCPDPNLLLKIYLKL
ncbi:peptidoglycan DD-metalloendopeptidase family protein [Planktosalinus lacus]|uniref:M23ase beta-sheet core domain-containing protein n=1 Tax=Planktosalinus lacus TaxID=1526573 RepID=A0A8J2YBS2_9FLAO|nr:peptidoglycan DD-metalloendopeptidase family protein [Planktosalinus lacus]GGD97984.1 hypothetical protein GCM10011312_21950 [Planktosalinus lacus]